MLEPASPPPISRSPTTRRPLQPRRGAGSPVVLEFYCEDETEGCDGRKPRVFRPLAGVRKARRQRRRHLAAGRRASHRRFAAKHGFAHRLLADPELVATKAYGLWEQKKLWGNEFMGVVRVTYLIDADGKVAGGASRRAASRGMRKRCWRRWQGWRGAESAVVPWAVCLARPLHHAARGPPIGGGGGGRRHEVRGAPPQSVGLARPLHHAARGPPPP